MQHMTQKPTLHSAPSDTPIAAAALRYLNAAWSVLPLRHGEKRPLILWEALQQKRADAATVAQWFTHWPNANIGIVTGEISNLIVLDVDPKHGGDDSLAELARCRKPWRP
jgi:Bifunctional DNA primase/polymerase, N-terminal